MRLADYAGSVLPIIFTVWLMSYIERFAEKVSPTMIKFFTKPMIVLLVTAPLALVVVGPFGIFLNDMVAAGAAIVDGRAGWLIPMLMGGLQPFLVITGTAWAMTPIATGQLTKNGFEMINGPGMLASILRKVRRRYVWHSAPRTRICASWLPLPVLPRCWGSLNPRCTG